MIRTAGITLVIFTLLLSMTETGKVVMLGYTVFTDFEKATHFCTCNGCSHQSGNETEFCVMEAGKGETDTGKTEPQHCDMSRTSADSSICSCDTAPAANMHILFNTLDKTALLATLRISTEVNSISTFRSRRPEKPVHIIRDIFHPPRT